MHFTLLGVERVQGEVEVTFIQCAILSSDGEGVVPAAVHLHCKHTEHRVSFKDVDDVCTSVLEGLLGCSTRIGVGI